MLKRYHFLPRFIQFDLCENRLVSFYIPGKIIWTSFIHKNYPPKRRYQPHMLWVVPMSMMTSSNGNIFPRNWPFVRGIHRSPVNSPHKGQWRGALVFSLICVWINDWVNNREAGDLRRYRAHYDVIVMNTSIWGSGNGVPVSHFTNGLLACNPTLAKMNFALFIISSIQSSQNFARTCHGARVVLNYTLYDFSMVLIASMFVLVYVMAWRQVIIWVSDGPFSPYIRLFAHTWILKQ